MGFGTLFIGYFLLLNIAYYSFTDVIAALIMSMGLYKLSPVGKPFKYAFYSSIAFSALGFFEFILEIIRMFSPTSSFDELFSFISIPRYTLIALTSVMMLTGIRDVAKEVKLTSLYKRASFMIAPTGALYVLLALLEVPLSFIENAKPLAVMSVLLLLFGFIAVIINLTLIYKAYMKICMPDEKDMPLKPSKFDFVNKFRERSEEKNREYAEYKIEKLKKKAEKRRKK